MGKRTKKWVIRKLSMLLVLLLTIISIMLPNNTICAWAADASGQCVNISEGIYTICSDYDSKIVLDVCGGKSADGTNILVYGAHGKDNQKFNIVKVKNGWYKIEAVQSGKVLDVSGGKKGKGVNIQLWTWNGTDSQLFQFFKAPSGGYYIKNKLGCYLDISGGKAKSGANVHTWNYHGGRSQIWTLQKTMMSNATNIAEGIYTICSGANSQFVIDVYGGKSADGTNIAVYETHGGDNQKFKITKVKNGWYKIEAVQSGKVLDVSGGKKGKGINIQLWTWNGTDSQLFQFFKASSGEYYIKNKLGYYLDISGGKTKSGANVHTWNYHGGKSQQWSLKKTNISSSKYDSLVGKVPTNINGKYYTRENISYQGGYKGQCTWWCYGRFAERTGIKLRTAPNGKRWLSANASDNRVKVVYGAANIQPNCIAVRLTGKWGHVMYIEDVKVINGVKYVYFTECNADGNGRYDVGRDCIVQKMTYTQFVRTKNPAGYIRAK